MWVLAVGAVWPPSTAGAGTTGGDPWEEEVDRARQATLEYRYAEAGKHLRLALKIAEAHQQPGRVTDTLARLGWIARERGEAAEALTLYERALVLAEDDPGPRQESLVIALVGLATVRYDTSDYAEAARIYGRALRIERHNPEPEIADMLGGLARVCTALGYLSEADQLYELAFKSMLVLSRAQRVGFYDVAVVARDAAAVATRQGAVARAEESLQLAREAAEKQPGPDSPMMASVLSELARIRRTQGRFEEAEELYGRALEISERALGAHHPWVAIMYRDVADLCAERGTHELAEPLYWWALLVLEINAGTQHPETIGAALGYADTLDAVGKHDEAAKLRAQYEPRRKEGKARRAAMREDVRKVLESLSDLLPPSNVADEASESRDPVGDQGPVHGTNAENPAAEGDLRVSEPVRKRAPTSSEEGNKDED